MQEPVPRFVQTRFVQFRQQRPKAGVNRAFLQARRSNRPAEEYREPTEEEWREFQQHFHTRKLELGDCAAPTAPPAPTNTPHPLPDARVDPAQRHRLLAIIRNLTERIKETRANGWPGELQGLLVRPPATGS